MSRRLAAYAVCVEGGRVLLARYVHPGGEGTWWTLPGGGVDPGEDPYDTIPREISEETGYSGVVDRLLGVDSRIIPNGDRAVPGVDHQNIGIYYAAHITAGTPRPEPNGETAESRWVPLAEVRTMPRSSLVDIGIALALTRPATGHVPPVEPDDLIRY